MEILNNIWMVLTTPNELNTELITLPFTFIEIYIGMIIFLTILNISANKKSKILYVILATLATSLSSFLIPEPWHVIIYYSSSFLLILAIFKLTLLKTLIALVCSASIFGIISTLVLNPYITILHISAEDLSTIPIYHAVFLLCDYAINLILISILKIQKIKLNVWEDIAQKNKNIIFINFIFGIFTLVVQAYVIFYYIDNLPVIITFLSCISLLSYFAISVFSLNRVMKLTLTTKKLESTQEYNKTLRILHDNVRGFKHDFDNIVTTIGGYVRTNDMEGLKNYYVQLEDDCQRVNNLYLLNPEIINNPRNLQLTY